MKPIHRRDVIREVRDRWMKSYDGMNGPTGWDRNRTFEQVRAALNALDLETCQPADVDAALGVGRWADNCCDECGESVPVLLHIGEDPDYGARYQELCIECLRQAVSELESAPALP